MRMWETERCLGVTSGACKGLKIEKYREKCMKSTYDSLESGEIYGMWKLKSENVSDGETFGSGFWRLWRYKDWEIHEIDLRPGEIYRVWELKSENVRDGEAFVRGVWWLWRVKDWEMHKIDLWFLRSWRNYTECENLRARMWETGGVCEWRLMVLGAQRLRNAEKMCETDLWFHRSWWNIRCVRA